MIIEDDFIIFSSGRTAYANRGIIGLDPELKVSEGYDGGLDWPPSQWRKEHPSPRHLTVDDMRELADYMINLWGKFRATL